MDQRQLLGVTTTPTILSLNSGSSSLKYAVFTGGREVGRGLVDGLGDGERHEAVHQVLVDVDELGITLDAVGHRIVHGGPALTDHVRIDGQVLRALEGAIDFAPLHLPDELAVIAAVTDRTPDLPQVACLDTAFHRTLPEVAHRFALPATITDRGVRRYGFHGLSYEYVVETVGAQRLGRCVIAHLGSGASLAAVDHGVCIDTTMGLTPTGGVVMGTRTGDLDPGVLLHLLRTGVVDQPGLARLVDYESGLLGVSGSTSDVRELLGARTAGDPSAQLALAVFAYSVRKAVGALAAALGGLDTLVFTGGVGEHAAAVRAEVVAPLDWLGLELDATANRDDGSATEGIVSVPGDRTVLVVPTDEEAMIARHTARLLDHP